jgi:hypothetical protein
MPAPPAHASDTATIATSNNMGVAGALFAAPPGSCTAAPGGELGACLDRGDAIVEAAGDGDFFTTDDWSDVNDGDIDGDGVPNGVDNCALVANPGQADADTDDIGDACDTGAATDVGTVHTLTDIGTSFVLPLCDKPYCGNLLKGDTAQVDENGDGVVDTAWDDKNNDGIIQNGEIDRTRTEQFAWGGTSVINNPALLELGLGNLFPAGVSRMRARLTLGDASMAGGCDGRIDNPACLDGVPTAPDPAYDPDYWGKCDPDLFHPSTSPNPTITTVAEGQHALDNCLWFYGAIPVFPAGNAPDDGAPDPLDNSFAVRELWVSQQVLKYVSSYTPDVKAFDQSLYAAYGFEGTADITRSRYLNDWQIVQADRDPNPDLNFVPNPYGSGEVVDAAPGPYEDTYTYFWAVQHVSLARARGEDFAGDPVTECGGVGVSDCDGLTNPTLDVFWGKEYIRNLVGDIVGIDWNQDFEYQEGEPCDEGCRGSGVGRENGFLFLTAQDVNGYFSSCINCDTPALEALGVEHAFDPAVDPGRYMPYESSWNVVPTIVHAD